MESKFIITPKLDKTVTMTIRITETANARLEAVSRKSGRSRNELINQAVRFAFDNMEFTQSIVNMDVT